MPKPEDLETLKKEKPHLWAAAKIIAGILKRMEQEEWEARLKAEKGA